MPPRRFPLLPTAPGPRPLAIEIRMPPLTAGAPPAACPTVPAIADWQSVTLVFPCTPAFPAQATIAGDVFVATPGPDLTTVYAWDIDLSSMTVPHMCVIQPEDPATFVAQFRGVYAANMPISSFNDGSVLSYFFMMRPDDPILSGVAQVSTYQRHIPDDPANGLTATVRFRVLCIPIDPG